MLLFGCAALSGFNQTRRIVLKSFTKLLAICLATGLVAACSSGPKVDDAQLAVKTTEQPVVAAPAPAPVAESKIVQVVVPDHLDPMSALSKNRSIFFDFDDYSVKKDYIPVVESHSKYLSANPKLTVRVEGNADERGGREYNLALGQKRAEAVARSMKLFGSKDQQIEAVSFGSEKPKALGHDETSWAQNRRVDITYQAK
jgi:peptidoglycan-associated lipoprotein